MDLDLLPPGQELGPGQKATDAISQTLAAISPGQMQDVMAGMKVSWRFLSMTPGAIALVVGLAWTRARDRIGIATRFPAKPLPLANTPNHKEYLQTLLQILLTTSTYLPLLLRYCRPASLTLDTDYHSTRTSASTPRCSAAISLRAVPSHAVDEHCGCIGIAGEFGLHIWKFGGVRSWQGGITRVRRDLRSQDFRRSEGQRWL